MALIEPSLLVQKWTDFIKLDGALSASLVWAGSDIILSPFDALQDRLGVASEKIAVWVKVKVKGGHLQDL